MYLRMSRRVKGLRLPHVCLGFRRNYLFVWHGWSRGVGAVDCIFASFLILDTICFCRMAGGSGEHGTDYRKEVQE